MSQIFLVHFRVGVKYFSKYLSQVQVPFHICKYKYKFKYSEYLEYIKYIKYFSIKYNSSTSTLVTNNNTSRRWIMLLITEYHITWSCFNRNFAGNIFKHSLIENVYMSS